MNLMYDLDRAGISELEISEISNSHYIVINSRKGDHLGMFMSLSQLYDLQKAITDHFETLESAAISEFDPVEIE